MTGIQTVNSTISAAYKLLAFACIAGFAAYDLKRKLVPDRALLCFCPVALLAPFVHTLPSPPPALLLLSFLTSLAGAASGFLILLAAAITSRNGTGVGGGDIKLAAVIGFIYGPSRMLAVLLTASGLACATSFIMGRKHRDGTLSLPFVPFLAAGSMAATITAIAL
ncbi:MAG: A24 family peptidase [Lachnospiraceae bacterium]|nr:A24 family peptidase [Lachnospiraceae bacterium]MCM1239015.1 A24 family peptidase [Lachnospiraceae bacterium]